MLLLGYIIKGYRRLIPTGPMRLMTDRHSGFLKVRTQFMIAHLYRR
jgi:hypothetical protein